MNAAAWRSYLVFRAGHCDGRARQSTNERGSGLDRVQVCAQGCKAAGVRVEYAPAYSTVPFPHKLPPVAILSESHTTVPSRELLTTIWYANVEELRGPATAQLKRGSSVSTPMTGDTRYSTRHCWGGASSAAVSCRDGTISPQHSTAQHSPHQQQQDGRTVRAPS